jgi:serine protease Do
MRGEAVGVTSARAPQGAGAASGGAVVPVDITGSILQQFVAAKPRPILGAHLGASTQGLTPELARSFGLGRTQGALVTSVDPGSPGALAGLRSGDVIVRYDGRTVANPMELSALLANTAPRQSVELSIVRNRAPRSLRVTLGEAADAAAASRGQDRGILDRAGLRFQRLTPRLAERLGIQEETGVVVTSVRSDSPAARAGIAVGDLIRAVNSTDVKTVADAEEGMAQSTGDSKEILVRVERDRSQRYIVINLG